MLSSSGVDGSLHEGVLGVTTSYPGTPYSTPYALIGAQSSTTDLISNLTITGMLSDGHPRCIGITTNSSKSGIVADLSSLGSFEPYHYIKY